MSTNPQEDICLCCTTAQLASTLPDFVSAAAYITFAREIGLLSSFRMAPDLRPIGQISSRQRSDNGDLEAPRISANI